MRIVMMRHAKRQRDPSEDSYMDKKLALNSGGEAQTRKLGAALLGRGIRPAAYFTSCFAHARQTGEILRETIRVDPIAPVVELCTLTPHYQGPAGSTGALWHGVKMLESVIHEAHLAVKNLGSLETIAVITHWPRIGQLLAAMTKQTALEATLIPYAEGAVVGAASIESLLDQQGKIEVPVLYQEHNP